MKPSQELVDAIYREKVLRARRQPLEEKFLAGARLFDYACAIARAGIRHQFLRFSDEEVEAELDRRIRIGQRIEVQNGLAADTQPHQDYPTA